MPLMTSKYWFLKRIVGVRQQTKNGVHVDADRCRHMASLGHNDSTKIFVSRCDFFQRKSSMLGAPNNFMKSVFISLICTAKSLWLLDSLWPVSTNTLTWKFFIGPLWGESTLSVTRDIVGHNCNLHAKHSRVVGYDIYLRQISRLFHEIEIFWKKWSC